MDLVTLAPRASAEERAAVDGVLGTATSRWEGGDRDVPADHRFSRGGHAARARRDLLLPVFHAIQARVGWISQPALEYACRRLTVPPAEAYGVAAFYQMFATAPRPPVVAHVCEDIACRTNGSEEVCADLERLLGPAGEPAFDGAATWLRTPCLGRCERGPTALFTVAGLVPETIAVAPVDATAVLEQLERAVRGRGLVPPALPIEPDDERLASVRRSIPQAGAPGLRLLRRAGVTDPRSLDDYLATGGYRGLRRAFEIGPSAVIDEVTASGLVGRGGAAFPTGRKWAAVAAQPTLPHYTVCNADESEPGTFKDRVLMEEDPYAIVEAMTIEGFATGSERGLLYLRAEYPLSAARMAHAIANARAAGHLGDDILGSGFAFDIELRRGAGAYVCGEETALFNSIEGKRGEPRNKPPFPVEVGLFGKPTAVNNIETLVNVPGIVADGGAAFATIGTEGSTGSKLFCLSGAVERPGVYELDFGATLGDLLALAGGVRGGARLQAVLLGGAAGAFVGPDALDLPLTFEGTRAAGVTLGSGVVMVFDEGTDLVGTLLRIAAFFRDESCGQCVPCRIGTVRQEELLARVAAGRPRGSLADELALLADLGRGMRDASICGLGQTASAAIESAVRAGLVDFGAAMSGGGPAAAGDAR
ncbi:MAG: NAD(P)H-dependent oxidoreductase subunit E [Chloroflexi bacterium]|jgi:NADH-quinone oxidoreductase subunit F|nr:NAD(P)H-dependent oxidoreductase subunit E [Chloroflexota bacterium]